MPDPRLVLAVALIGLTGCAGAERGERGRASGSPPASPLVALERPEFGEADGGKPVWSATAARAAYRPESKVVDLQDVEASFFEDGRVVTRGEAPSAVWRQAERGLYLSGGVALTATATRTGVAAREARWETAGGSLVASGGVRFWQGGNRLSAAALRADRALRRVELTGGVHGTFALGPGTGVALPGSNPRRHP